MQKAPVWIRSHEWQHRRNSSEEFFGEPERAAEEECRKDAFSQAKRYAEHLNKALKEMLP